MAVVQQQVKAVEVVMVAPQESRPSPVANPAQTAPPQPGANSQSRASRTVRPSRGARVTATEYYASAVLDDPRNRETQQKLAALGSDERLIQLCNIEAIEQLRRWKTGFVPDHVVAYATADPSMTATSLKAPGAAIHAGGKWFGLSFNCVASADFSHVTVFDFRLGRPIPRKEWEQDNLPEQIDGDLTD